jgi:hypothetical protein
MRPSLKKLLNDAWFGPATFEEVAKANKVSTRTLQRFWSAQKRSGALPQTARPHFAAFDHTAVKAAEVEAPIVEAAGADDVIEVAGVSCLSRHAAPIASPWGLSITEGDPLLAALREHHADIDFADAHIAPELLRERDKRRAAAKGEQ